MSLGEWEVFGEGQELTVVLGGVVGVGDGGRSWKGRRQGVDR